MDNKLIKLRNQLNKRFDDVIEWVLMNSNYIIEVAKDEADNLINNSDENTLKELLKEIKIKS